jgi:hypothetical protein
MHIITLHIPVYSFYVQFLLIFLFCAKKSCVLNIKVRWSCVLVGLLEEDFILYYYVYLMIQDIYLNIL